MGRHQDPGGDASRNDHRQGGLLIRCVSLGFLRCSFAEEVGIEDQPGSGLHYLHRADYLQPSGM